MSDSATSSRVGAIEPSPEHAATLWVSRLADAIRARVWTLGVMGAMVAWSLSLFAVTRDHYANFRLARFDLGNMVQAVWSTAHGRPLETTIGPTGEQATRLASHVDPILALLTPLWIVMPSPLTLVAVQIVAVALGALPLFWLARRHLSSERAAALLALTYLLYPWTAWTAVDAFHPVTLAIPLFLFCVWFLDSGRLVPFGACAVLAMATGELMALPIAALGIWYALSRKSRWAGLGIAGVGLAWSLVAVEVVVPAFSGGSSVFYGAYREVGGSPGGIVETALTDPGTILSAMSRGNDLLYLFLLAVPLAGAFATGLGLVAVAIPQLAVNLMAGFDATTDPHAHYVAGVLPFLFAAMAIGFARFSTLGRVRAAILVLTLSLASTIVVGPWPGALGGTPAWYRMDTPATHIEALREAVSLVPPDAPVSSTNRIGSHLSARRYVYSVPVVGRAKWIVIDSTDAWIPDTVGGFPDEERLHTFQVRIEGSPQWRRVFDESDILVFRKLDA